MRRIQRAFIWQILITGYWDNHSGEITMTPFVSNRATLSDATVQYIENKKMKFMENVLPKILHSFLSLILFFKLRIIHNNIDYKTVSVDLYFS
jgi:hypothetical protein